MKKDQENITNMKNLYFFFPYKEVGGVSVLFLRLANNLSTMNLYNIFLIDYVDGYMAKNYNKETNIKLIEYHSNKDICFKGNDIVIFQSMPLWGIPENLKFDNNTSIIYWNLHPYNLFGMAPAIYNKFKNIFIQKLVVLGFRYFIYYYDRKAIEIFNKKKSIYFMDGENFDKTKELLSIKIKEPVFLPLIIEDIKNVKQNYLPKDNTLSCIWLGSIVESKVHILVYTLKKLNQIANNLKKYITFTVIGTGTYLKYLQLESYSLKNIDVQYIDYISPTDLEKVLLDIDVGFAMGTSALDFAKYGLPTVLLDFSYKEVFCECKFNWLYNTKDFTLARQITDELCEDNNKSLESIILELEDYQTVSQKSFEYVKNNFDINTNVNKFLSLLKKSRLVYKDLDEKSFEMNVFHKFVGMKKYYGI